MGSSRRRGQGWGPGRGSRSAEGSRFGVKVVVKVRGKGCGIKVRVMIGGHKVRGQGRWSRSGYRSWGPVMRGVKVWGPGRGSRSGEGSRFGVKGSRSLGHGQVMIDGHKVWGQGRGSMLGVKVRGVVKVMERGSMSGGLGSDGRWGEVGDKQSLPFKNS